GEKIVPAPIKKRKRKGDLVLREKALQAVNTAFVVFEQKRQTAGAESVANRHDRGQLLAPAIFAMISGREARTIARRARGDRPVRLRRPKRQPERKIVHVAL